MKVQKNRRKFIDSPALHIKIASLLCILGILFLQSDIVTLAAGKVYTATATPYYRHPVTGIVEDAGNNEGIGQGMTESVLNPTALIEESKDGTLYVTVRFYLAEYLSDVKFWTQKRDETDWNSVSYTIMQENAGGEYCTDYRLEIPAEDAFVKSSFFVAPMGRDVIFYMDFSDFKEGSGDFIVSGDAIAGTEAAQISGVSTGSADSGTGSTGTAGDNTGSTETAKNNNGDARELLNSTQGLVLSDESLLTSKKTTADSSGTGEETGETAKTGGTVKIAGTGAAGTEESEPAGTADGETVNAAGTVSSKTQINGAVPSLSWKLVWQCILIITLPGFLVGSGLLILLNCLRGGKNKNDNRN